MGISKCLFLELYWPSYQPMKSKAAVDCPHNRIETGGKTQNLHVVMWNCKRIGQSGNRIETHPLYLYKLTTMLTPWLLYGLHREKKILRPRTVNPLNAMWTLQI